MKLRIFTLVWGSYLDWFENACVQSLSWPSNLETIRKYAVEWNVYTRPEDEPRIRSILQHVGVPVQIHPFGMRNSSGETLQPAVLDHFRNCVQEGHGFLMAPPDTIFGEGSLAAICKAGEAKGVCIAVPHVRANAGTFQVGKEPISNPRLVDLAFRNLHKTWADANAELANTNSFLGGVSWRQIRPSLYTVSHRLPTCYLGNIDQSDVDWFAGQHETGAYDHSWPAKLVKEQRHRVIASSDAAFIVELTHAHENHPPVAPPRDVGAPDEYFRDHEHHYCNRNIVAIFRGVNG